MTSLGRDSFTKGLETARDLLTHPAFTAELAKQIRQPGGVDIAIQALLAAFRLSHPVDEQRENGCTSHFDASRIAREVAARGGVHKIGRNLVRCAFVFWKHDMPLSFHVLEEMRRRVCAEPHRTAIFQLDTTDTDRACLVILGPYWDPNIHLAQQCYEVWYRTETYREGVYIFNIQNSKLSRTND